MEKILSKYYNLTEAKKYNDFIDSLRKQESYSKIDEVEHIYKLSKVSGDHREISNYVPGSDTYNEIVENNKAYELSQKELENFQYSCQRVSEESHHESRFSISIFRHKYVSEKKVSVGGYLDDGSYEPYLDTKTVPAENVFFSVGMYMDDRIIQGSEDWDKLYVSYIREDSRGSTDLIDEAISTIEYLNQIIFAHELAERIGIKFNLLLKIFDIQEIEHYSNWGDKFIKYKDKNYYDRDILRLVKEYKEAKERKYICGDEIVEYPRNIKYIDFKEREYKILNN